MKATRGLGIFVKFRGVPNRRRSRFRFTKMSFPSQSLASNGFPITFRSIRLHIVSNDKFWIDESPKFPRFRI